MVQIRIRDTEGCESQPHLLWDTIWIQRTDASGGYGDWIMAGPNDQAESAGGLRSEMALHTATILCLFSDRSLPDGYDSPNDDGDRRGWWGDSVKLQGEPAGEFGSLLWTLERSVIDDRVVQLAADYAREALEVLLEQGAVARTEVETAGDAARGLLTMTVRHYSAAGAIRYEQRFSVLWGQEASPKPMNFGDQSLAYITA